MELNFTKDCISFEKELNQLDQFVIDFTTILNALDIKYVIISGYVAILFGRNRASEDIDLFIEKIDFSKFQTLWNVLEKQFDCIITNTVDEAYHQYLKEDFALRFARKGEVIPNMEIKFCKDPLDFLSLQEKKQVVLNKHSLFISPLELQVSFKLFLGTQKDIEDARYLFALFKDHLNQSLLHSFSRKLKIEEELKRYLP